MTLSYPVHLIATQVSSQDETTQTAENVVEDNEQSDEKEIKKPTFAQSWRKVVTLRWTALTKADAWNIGAPITGAVALGLLSRYFPQNIVANNDNNNPGHNNPGGGIDDFSDFDSSDDLNDNLDNSALLANINKNLPSEIQTKIANQAAEASLLKSVKKAGLMIDKLQQKRAILEGSAIYTVDDYAKNLRMYQLQGRLSIWGYLSFNLSSHYYIDPRELGIEDEDIGDLVSDLYEMNFVGNWVYYNLTIPQVDLLERVWNAMKKRKTFTIYCLSEDGKVFLTFDKKMRTFLLKSLDIELKIEND